MLNLKDRQLLLECLRPPKGYRLDRALGTSYSLDLLAALTAPLAFTFFDWEDQEGRPTADPLALLEAIRQYAGRILLFCQAGETRLPPPAQRLIAYLERSVVPVQTRHPEGVFHAKVWALRFTADGEPVRYRFLCLTRNLTFDRSWDNILAIEGPVVDRQRAIAANRPLSDFIRALPELALRPLAADQQAVVSQMADELLRVRFDDLPPDVESVGFWPLGIVGAKEPPFLAGDRPLLVMAPFLSAGFLRRVAHAERACTLISRPDQLAALPRNALAGFQAIYALDPAAEDQPEDELLEDPGLAGLHAKLFIAEDGWNASVFTGSANATEAALSRNVEFLTELTGKKSQWGIGAFLDSEGSKSGIHALLRRVQPEDLAPVSPEVQRQQDLEDRLSQLRRELARLPMTLRVVNAEGACQLELLADAALPAAAGLELRCWPATLRADAGQRPDAGPGLVAGFDLADSGAITSFVAWELVLSESGTTARSTCVLNLPLEGAPADRLEQLLAIHLQNREQLMRLLWLLLQSESQRSTQLIGVMVNQADGQGRSAVSSGYPVFEHLVRCVVDGPERLRDVGRLVEDLGRSPEGRALLPEGLLDLWSAVKTAMEDVRA